MMFGALGLAKKVKADSLHICRSDSVDAGAIVTTGSEDRKFCYLQHVLKSYVQIQAI